MQARRRSITCTSARRAQRGVLAYVLFVLMSLLAGLTALAVDVGQMYGLRTELQNAADACALAAAQQLATGDKTSAVVGTSAAQETVLQNRKSWFGGQYSGTLSTTITFSSSPSSASWITSAGIAGTATNYRYARCTLTRNNLPRWFAYTRLGKRYFSVMAQATAWRPASSYTGNNCGFMPGTCSQVASLVQ